MFLRRIVITLPLLVKRSQRQLPSFMLQFPDVLFNLVFFLHRADSRGIPDRYGVRELGVTLRRFLLENGRTLAYIRAPQLVMLSLVWSSRPSLSVSLMYPCLLFSSRHAQNVHGARAKPETVAARQSC